MEKTVSGASGEEGCGSRISTKGLLSRSFRFCSSSPSLSPPASLRTNLLLFQHLSSIIMHFSLSLITLAFVTAASALPTSAPLDLTPRQYGEAGPSGEVITPVGNTHYKVGDKIDFAYQRVITKGAWTNSLNIVLKTFDTLDGEDYNANVITVSQATRSLPKRVNADHFPVACLRYPRLPFVGFASHV